MAEKQTPSFPREVYSITVAGSMNPRIHHPQWYRVIGAISEEELQQSLKERMAISPIITQFSVESARFAVACQADRWDIQTDSRGGTNRILDIAVKVFQKLPETPVQFYALTAARHLDTLLSNIKEELAKLMVGLGIGFPEGRSPGSTLELAVAADEYLSTLQVQPSMLSENAVFVSYADQFQKAGIGPLSSVGALIMARYGAYLNRADEVAETVVSKLNARVIKPNDTGQ
jgi:hypothetical protein